ncbi:MAG: alpha-glucosidase [Bacteroidales bacterium]|nr:alpha-glucosidase [Bacteroidales bacterium]
MRNLKVLLFFLLVSCFSFAPAQAQNSEKAWWKESVFYQIYMPSFQDSNGDGYSDFNGMTARLDYLDSLGIKGVWLTPFLKSPKVDNGYDIADYTQIDPTYGSMIDFKIFLTEAHSRELKVIIDMVLNHCSTDHYWFQEARKSKDNPYRDYFIWRNEPNNWESFFGGSAWEYDSLTGQYYYHKFDRRMVDFNWQNPAVVEEMQQILRFWLDLGVDGFRLDVINFLTTDGVLADNPTENGEQQHLYDIDQPGLKAALKTLRKTVDEYPNRLLVGEVGSDKLELLSQYQSPEMMDVVFNFNFGSIPEFDAARIFKEIQQMENQMPAYPTLFFGSHDNPRLMSRLADDDPKRALALASLMLTARGVPFIYYGEEIGMQNILAETPEQIVDIQGKTQYALALAKGQTEAEALVYANKHNRDKSRSPMQWDSSPNAGFTEGKPWIGLHKNYQETNVKAASENPESIFNQYKKLIRLRNSLKALQYGDYTDLRFEDGLIFYTKTIENQSVSVVINFGSKTTISIPDEAKIHFGSKVLETNGFAIFEQ